MNPRIVALCGPLEGSVFPITESQDLIIGRSKNNGIRLDDPTVALRHCGIDFSYGRSLLYVLENVYGTFVNGFCFPGRILVHGDRIRIGISLFVYLDRDAVDPACLKLTDAEKKWYHSARFPQMSSYEAAKSTVLDAFLEINASINQIRDADEIQERVLQLIFQVIPAECVAILLAGHDQDRFISTKYARAGSSNGEPFPIDQTISKKALTEGARVYGEKVVCCPLTTSSTKVGVIYATMPKDGFEWFLASHMQLFASIAGLTAVALEHARYVEWLERQNQHLKEVVNVEHGMVGHSQKQSEIDEFINRAAPSDRPVLILGDTGTGKELVARAIHRNSLRASTEFVAVNCGALPENLLESELFGHEKGAFTGATAQRRGLFELADGGTVFLDEIGEMPLTMQPALLRVLQEGEFKRLGGNVLVKVDVRVIAATNRNLEKAVEEGRFRADLFFRLNVLPIEMPRLSERRDDIPLLAAYFIKKHRDARRQPYPTVLGISPEAHQLLAAYDWPGNIRQLENAIERAVALGVSPYILPEDLPKALRRETSGMDAGDVYEREFVVFRKSLFERVLAETGGNRLEAARRLGFHPTHFARLCHELNIKKDTGGSL